MASNQHWKLGLLDAMKDPNLRIISTDELVAIKDKYPKAKLHFLILPLENIRSIFYLTRDHIKLLEEMKLLAVNVIETTGHPVDEFNIGFHAAPSMDRLHMHVISKDFHSPCLKTKQHWNTFNTKYFLSTEFLIDQLRNTGKIEKFNEQYIKGLLATELACHVCKSKVKNMPTLKEHILTHVNESRKFE